MKKPESKSSSTTRHPEGCSLKGQHIRDLKPIFAKGKNANWFAIFIWVFIILFALFCAIVISSPRQDLSKRGFIPCTEKFIEEISACNKQKLCSVKSIFNNTACDFGVITTGLSNWIKGNQSTPWENYIFEPILEQEEGLKEFYQENKNLSEQMSNLKQKHKEIENGN